MRDWSLLKCGVSLILTSQIALLDNDGVTQSVKTKLVVLLGKLFRIANSLFETGKCNGSIDCCSLIRSSFSRVGIRWVFDAGSKTGIGSIFCGGSEFFCSWNSLSFFGSSVKRSLLSSCTSCSSSWVQFINDSLILFLLFNCILCDSFVCKSINKFLGSISSISLVLQFTLGCD